MAERAPTWEPPHDEGPEQHQRGVDDELRPQQTPDAGQHPEEHGEREGRTTPPADGDDRGDRHEHHHEALTHQRGVVEDQEAVDRTDRRGDESLGGAEEFATRQPDETHTEGPEKHAEQSLLVRGVHAEEPCTGEHDRPCGRMRHRGLLEARRQLDGDLLAEMLELAPLGAVRVALEVAERVDVAMSLGHQRRRLRIEQGITGGRTIPLGEGEVGQAGTEGHHDDEPEDQPEAPPIHGSRFGADDG